MKNQGPSRVQTLNVTSKVAPYPSFLIRAMAPEEPAPRTCITGAGASFGPVDFSPTRSHKQRLRLSLVYGCGSPTRLSYYLV